MSSFTSHQPASHQPATARPRAVIKLGSSSVTRSTGPDPTLLSATLEACLSAQAAGWDCVLVSSGAVSAGAARLAPATAPPQSPGQRHASPASATLKAALGQPYLMGMYVQLAGFLHGQVCQLLVSESDVRSATHMQALTQVIAEALQHQVLPIVNGNDAVDRSELDNDALAAGLAVLLGADRLLLLTDVDGVLDTKGQVITQAQPHELPQITTRPGGSGRGGIRSKLAAAQLAALNGVTTVIARAQEPTSISRALSGQTVGTQIDAAATCPAPNAAWLAAAAPQRGVLTINREAEASIRKGSSLYGSGVKRVTGSFEPGDVVAIRSPAGHLLGRGVVNTSSLLLTNMRALRKDEVDLLLLTCLASSLELHTGPTAADRGTGASTGAVTWIEGQPSADSSTADQSGAELATIDETGADPATFRPQLVEALAAIRGHSLPTRRRLAQDVLRLLNRYAIQTLVAHTQGGSLGGSTGSGADSVRGASSPPVLPNVQVVDKENLYVFAPATQSDSD